MDKRKIYLRHFPIEQRATGSPTTATRLWARVMAVFNNLALDKNPKSVSASSLCRTHVFRVRTVDKNMALNCLP